MGAGGVKRESAMSYVNQQNLKLQKRRHSIQRVTPEEAIAQVNEVVDKANDQIARAVAYAGAWEGVATGLYQENEELRQQVEKLEQERDELKAENNRLSRKVTKKQGKRKGQEWEDE